MKHRAPNWVKQLLDHSIEDLKKATLNRKRQIENRRYDSKVVTLVIAVALMACVVGVWQFLTPGPLVDIKNTSDPSLFVEVTEATISFSGETPEQQEEAIQHPVSLPFREYDTLPGYDPKNMWLSFQVQTPKRTMTEHSVGLFIPKIYGDFKIYANGSLLSSGQDHDSILPVLSDNIRIQILIHKTSHRFGIRSSLKPMAGPINELHGFRKTFFEQEQLVPKSSLVQLVAAFFFGFIFVLIRNKPELAILTLLFMVNTGVALLAHYSYQSSSGQIRQLSEYAYYPTLIARSLILYLFLLEFFRNTGEQIRTHFVQLAQRAIVGVPLLGFIISRWVEFPNLLQLTVVSMDAFLLLSSALYVVPVLYFIYINRLGYERLILAAGMATSILYSLSMSIWSLTLSSANFTTEYLDHIYTFFAAAIFAILGIARAEKQNITLTKTLSREARDRLLLQNHYNPTHSRGFIIVVDMLDYTATLNNLQPEQRLPFVQGLLTHLLNHFDDWSKVAETGDGFFLALEGNCTEEKLFGVVQTIDELFSQEISLLDLVPSLPQELNQPIQFRAGVAYGDYQQGIIETKNQATDFIISCEVNSLSRILGHEKQQYVRILVNEDTERFASLFPNSQLSINAKDGQYAAFHLNHTLIKSLPPVKADGPSTAEDVPSAS